MTTQKRTLISLDDILGLEYECAHCGARYAVPIKKLDRVATQCANCHEPWMSRGVSVPLSDQDSVQYFANVVRDLQGRQLQGVTLRLEIKSEPA